MIDSISISNLDDYISYGKVYSGDINIEFTQGELNKVDPRVPNTLKALQTIFNTARWDWGITNYPKRTNQNLVFKNEEDFITISIKFSGKYRYVLLIDSGYFTEVDGGGIFSERIEDIETHETLIEYSALDEVFNNNTKLDIDHYSGIFSIYRYMEKEERNILEELKNSFIILDWKEDSLGSGATLGTLREYLNKVYNLSDEYIWKVWEEYIPNLDLGILKVYKDIAVFGWGSDGENSPITLPMNCFGTGAITLFRILPVLLIKDKTIVVDNICSCFSELHPILKKHLFENILFGPTEIEREIIMSNEYDDHGFEFDDLKLKGITN